MDFQLTAVWLIVAGAALYVVRALWKSLRGSGKACGSGCGKCATAKDDEQPGRIPLEQVKTK